MATTSKKNGAIYSSMGRPSTGGALSTFPATIKAEILKLRKQYSGWGAKTLHTELRIDPKFSGLKLPSIRTIGLFLKQEGLVHLYNKHAPMPESKIQSAVRPHQIWQLDAQGGCELKGIGSIAMINIKDVYTKTYCMAFPNRKKSIYGHSKRSDYQCALRMAFMEYGLPELIQTDHEGVFYENKGKSPFPTLFHLWLTALGISQSFSRFNTPTDQGAVERMHQTMEKQAIQGIRHSDWETLFNFCQSRRRFMNQSFPCSRLNNQAPYQAFAKAKHSERHYQPQSEKRMLELNKVYAFLEKGKWYRSISKGRSMTLGGQVYYLAKATPASQCMITFCSKTLMLSFHDDKEHLIQKLPIKGINKEILMGEVFWKITNIQLELPFSWDTQKVSTTFLHNT